MKLVGQRQYERVMQWRQRSDIWTLLAVADGLAWTASGTLILAIVALLRGMPVPLNLIPVIAPALGCVSVTVGVITGVRMGNRQVGSFHEVQALLFASALGTVASSIVLAIWIPFGKILVASAFLTGIFGLITMFSVRYVGRSLLDTARRRAHPASGQPVLVFGAGDAGEAVVKALLYSPESTWTPVALLDDDPAKARLRLHGVPVVGNHRHIAEAAFRFGAKGLVIAMPSAPPSVVADAARRGTEARLRVKLLPSSARLIDGDAKLPQLRDIQLEDFLGRPRVRTDVESICDYITAKRVLVTGAGGSIGSELCRAISRFDPSELLMLDRDESALHSLQLRLEGRALCNSGSLILANVRDAERIREVFELARPDVVFHAAALKHLSVLETHATEAFKTNVIGTLNVLRCASEVGVLHLVNVSTDKAADPTSVLGASKRIAERLTAGIGANNDTAHTFLSVRFGNVLGSRGSVVPTFRHQICQGGPITITHPDVERFFMTVEEAVELMLQAGALGKNGQVLVLDMGEPVRIIDLAKQLSAQLRPDDDVPIVITGLSPGEKLSEVLVSAEDSPPTRVHPAILAVTVPPLEASELGEQSWYDAEEMRQRLFDLASLRQVEVSVH